MTHKLRRFDAEYLGDLKYYKCDVCGIVVWYDNKNGTYFVSRNIYLNQPFGGKLLSEVSCNDFLIREIIE